MNIRVFRRTDTSSWPIDVDRQRVLTAMIEEIRGWGLRPISMGTAAMALKRFVRWADGLNEPLSRRSVVALLVRYDSDSVDQTWILRRAACGLDLTAREREKLFPSAQRITTNDEWRLQLDVDGRGTGDVDFSRLLAPGYAAQSLKQWRLAREAHIAEIDMTSPRYKFVIALRDEFRSIQTEKSKTTATLKTAWDFLRLWFVWSDTQGLTLDEANSVTALQRYAIHLTQRSRAGSLKAISARRMVEQPMHLVAMALRRPAYEIKLTLHLPELKESGLTTPRPDMARLKVFCANLHALIISLQPELIRSIRETPSSIFLWTEEGDRREFNLPAPYNGYGSQIDTRAANLELIRLRIWAECHRFMAITGTNLSVTRAITIGQWSTNDLVWKQRAGKYVDPRATRAYARHIDRHVSFLAEFLPGGISQNTRLFPGIATFTRNGRELVAQSRAGTLKWKIGPWMDNSKSPVRRWLITTDMRTFSSRQLRQAKATWLLRRYGGDPLPASRDLDNTPEVLTTNYGGRGNLDCAAPEWSQHWASPQLAAALVPGKCSSPGSHEPVNEQPGSGGCSEGACLSCVNYRGEDSLDYIHRLLTYQQLLRMRAPGNPEAEQPIERIDRIVADYLNRHAEQEPTVKKLHKSIGVNPHPRFAALVQLGDRLWR